MPVVPTLAQDYPEWHKGRSAFSLWYLELHSPELLAYLAQLRADFADILFQPNTRQFHITLFICGFLNSEISSPSVQNPETQTSETPNSAIQYSYDDFSLQNFHAQLQQLQALELRPFKLKTGKINSFESALFIEIEDAEGDLNRIRQQLYQCSDEIAPLQYCPHITIGLYGRTLDSDEVFSRIQAIEQRSFEFEVRQLTFGRYTAQQLQGELSALHQFHLGVP
jgi:2'-5' RNA ligase